MMKTNHQRGNIMKNILIGIARYIAWCIKGIRRKIKHMTPAQKRMTIIAAFWLIAGCLIGSGVGRASERKRSEAKMKQAVAKVQKKADKELDSMEKEL